RAPAPPAALYPGAGTHTTSALRSAGVPRLLPSFPTRRSSDLAVFFGETGYFIQVGRLPEDMDGDDSFGSLRHLFFQLGYIQIARDRKSTRLNSSHVKISYAVFCLKKTKTTTEPLTLPPHDGAC